MKIGIVVPVKRGSIRGNEVTALRWQSIFDELGYEATVSTTRDPLPQVDLLIAIHAIHSNEMVCRFRKEYPQRPIVVCLSGTDLHGVFQEGVFQEGVVQKGDADASVDPNRETAEQSLQLADAVLLLEPNGMKKIPSYLHSKCHVIFQSAEIVSKESSDDDSGDFTISVIGHLRKPKDPMLAAKATRQLPKQSRIRLMHVGEILESEYETEVQAELKSNPRYSWLGKLDHVATMQILVNSDLTVLSSIHEGAPSIISEAVVNDIPILATRIDATEGMLGNDYPGLFHVGDDKDLARLMERSEQDPDYLNQLRVGIHENKTKFTRQAEMEGWQVLIASVGS